MEPKPFIVAIEGIDGSGKHSLAQALFASLSERGLRVTLVSFPRYATAPWGTVISRLLNADTAGLADSPAGTALAFAADRADWWRSESTTETDVWLIDRYIASNLAFGAVRALAEGVERHAFMEWVIGLETETFGLPRPSLQILLDVSPSLTRERLRARRPLDDFEMSTELQNGALFEYQRIASECTLGEWLVVAPLSTDHPEDISRHILNVSLDRILRDGST